MKAALVLVALLAGSFSGSFAHAETAVYTGDLNGSPVTLTIETEPAKLDAHYIACQVNDVPCDGLGQYSYVVHPGEATISYGNETGVKPLSFMFYTGEESTVNGKLNGGFLFVDRTASTGNKVAGVNFYQDAQLQNKVAVTVAGLAAKSFAFPWTYTLRWDDRDDEGRHNGFSNGSVVLVRQ